MACMRRFAFALVLLAASCSSSQLRAAGTNMIRVERATAGVVDGVVAYKDTVKEDCIAQNLATEAERAACVERAVKVLSISQVGVVAVKAALASFWALYPVLEEKLARGERIEAGDMADLAARGTEVVEAYQQLIRAVQEAKR